MQEDEKAGLRAGQRAFNRLHESDPDLADALRAGEADPYYDDARLDAFHAAVAALRAARGDGATPPPEALEEHQRLLERLRDHSPTLTALLEEAGDESEDGEDLIYRFWHQSLKVYGLQQLTLRIHAALRSVSGKPLESMYERLVKEGTGRTFTLSDNDAWLEATGPIVTAYLHSVHLLKLAARYSRQDDPIPPLLPSGWATLAHLYRIR